MSEERLKSENLLSSLETDTEQSVRYVNLPDLDIGSEVTVVCENKWKQDNREAKEETSNIRGVVESAKVENKDDIEAGLGSLKLETLFPQREECIQKDKIAQLRESEDRNLILGEILQQDTEGDTLLHVAVICMCDKLACNIIMILKHLGGDIDLQNFMHQTALHLAVITRQENVVRELLKAGASVSKRDYELQTPMHIACKKDNYAMLETILKYGPSHKGSSANPLNIHNADGEACLHISVNMNNVHMVQLLVSNGADVNIPHHKNGRSPLHVAAELGLVDMTKYLVSVPLIDVDRPTYNNETAADIAQMREKPEVVNLLEK